MDKKRIYQTVKDTIFQLASLHLFIILLRAVFTGDYGYLNMADIMDLKFFFPDLQYTALVGIITGIPVLIVLFINYSRAKVKK